MFQKMHQISLGGILMASRQGTSQDLKQSFPIWTCQRLAYASENNFFLIENFRSGMQNYQIQSIRARRLNPVTPKTQDLISNSPYELPYSSCDVNLENLALDQLTISLQIFFFILITCLFAILLILLGEIGVKGLRINKRPQKEVDKTENTCILNMAKVEVYISPAKLIPAGPILLLIRLFY